MSWQIILHPEFEEEFLGLAEEVQDATAKMSGLLARFGPQLGRPFVDTLAGNKSGVSQKRFYKELIRKADLRFTDWLKA